MNPRNLLNLTCAVRRPTFAATATSGGFAVATLADVYTAIVCAVQAMSSSESRQYSRESGRTMFWVFLPIEYTIKTQDRIVPDTGSYAAKVLSVTGPPQDEAGRASHFRFPCELLEGGGEA